MFVHGFTDSENCKNWTPRKISRYTVVLDSYSQVNELEGELPLQKMQLSQVVKEKDSLQKQLDTLTAQLANSEGQVGREKIKASTLQVYTCTFTHYVWDSFKLCWQVKVDELEEELHAKTDQLLHAFSRQNELESEISSVRKKQHAALENAAKLESDVCQY